MNARKAAEYYHDRGGEHMTARKLLRLARLDQIGHVRENARVIWFKELHIDRYLAKKEKNSN